MPRRYNKMEVVGALVEVARPVMLRAVKPDSCVVMTRVAIEVLRSFGYEADPMNVECVILNAKFMELGDAGKIRVDEAIPEWAIEEGAWAVGIGVNPKPRDMGHVVAILDDLLIDLSIDQGTRRLKGIVLKPLVLKMDIENLDQAHQFFNNDGVLVSYRLRPDLKRWVESVDWIRFNARYRNYVAEIIRTMKRRLDK